MNDMLLRPSLLVLLALAVLPLASPASAQAALPMPYMDDFEGMLNWTIPPVSGASVGTCATCTATPCQLARGDIRSGYQSSFPPMGNNALVLDSEHRGPAFGAGSWPSGLPLMDIDDPLTEWAIEVPGHMGTAEIVLDTTGYTALTLQFDFTFIVDLAHRSQFTVEIDDGTGAGYQIPLGPNMNGPMGNSYIPDECVICPGACPGCGGAYNPMAWIHETIDLSAFTAGPGFKIRFRWIVRHNYDGSVCSSNGTAVLIDNVIVDGITMGVGVSGPFPPTPMMVRADQMGVDATPFRVASFMQTSTYDSIEITADGTADDSVDITEVYLYEDTDASLTLTMGDVLIDMLGGPFPMDNGSHTFPLPAPITLMAGMGVDYLLVADLAGTAVAGETIRIDVTDVNVTMPMGQTASGTPRPGSELTVQNSDLEVDVGPNNPAMARGVVGQMGAVIGQVQFASIGSGTSVTGLTISAIGSGDDRNGIDMAYAYWDQNGNGRVDMGEPAVWSGSYSSDNGDLAMTFMPPVDVSIIGPEQVLIVYDYSSIAAMPGVAENFCYRIDSAMDVTSSAQSTTIVPMTITQCSTVTDSCPRTLCGDCDQSGSVNIVDALLAAQDAAMALSPPLSGSAFSNCNVTGAVEPDPQAAVNILDALLIAQDAAGLPVTLMCC